jgi:PAS domain S-box-containing protein
MDMLTSPPPGGFASDIWRQLADHVPHMLWMADAQGRLTWTNRCCSDTLGSSPEDLVGRGWDSLVHPDDSERVAADWSAAVADGAAFETVARLKAANGRVRHHQFKAEPHRDANGTVAHWFGSSTDVTDRIAAARHDADLARVEAERASAERALSDANARFRAVHNNTEMAIFLLDEQMHCLYANDAAESLTGYSFAELQGRALHDVVHPLKPDGSPYPVHECPIGEGIPERRQSEGEEMFVARDGSFYPVYYSASPVFDEQGRAVGTVLEARNIAAAKARARQSLKPARRSSGQLPKRCLDCCSLPMRLVRTPTSIVSTGSIPVSTRQRRANGGAG